MLPDVFLEPIVRAALIEDWGRAGDVTADALIAKESRHKARLVARVPGVLCGVACARLAFALTEASLQIDVMKDDGAALQKDDVVIALYGSTRGLLMAERVALNFVTHLSGIASLTQKYVDAVKGTKARIAATRKTIPVLRALQKYAVTVGGGLPHRYGLDDAIVIKDNHIAAVGSVLEAVKRARAAAGHLVKVEVEIDNIEQLEAALAGAPDVVMLDNFSLGDMEYAVKLIDGGAVVEASGGITLANVRAVAQTGVDVISIGALTHSAPALDLALDF